MDELIVSAVEPSLAFIDAIAVAKMVLQSRSDPLFTVNLGTSLTVRKAQVEV